MGGVLAALSGIVLGSTHFSGEHAFGNGVAGDAGIHWRSTLNSVELGVNVSTQYRIASAEERAHLVDMSQSDGNEFLTRISEQPPGQTSQVYHAGCHCGHVRLTICLSPPLSEYQVMRCNCSICVSKGYLLCCKFTYSACKGIAPADTRFPMQMHPLIKSTGRIVR